MPRTPVYFFSHGGPNIIEDTKHPAFASLQSIGREITQKVKPKAVIVVSAHWQAGASTVEVNTAELQPLIYDYYGFPTRFYELQYPNTGSASLANLILSRLRGAGIDARGVKRGLDHGVFAPFTVAFNPEQNPLGVPLVQMSLFDNDDADAHYKLGQALSGLRDEGVAIIVSGMAVHNLREMWAASGKPTPMPYAVSFLQALDEAVQAEPRDRQAAMAALLKRSDARRAHPSFEHLLPIHVGAGAAGNDTGKLLFSLPEGSMGWAQYRFGEVQAV
ncbi:extradiol ring-cleavage dioxygenase [Myriangium duriaei CBS 260.36]|uniref:Extradiol ring-cleavage dioxygenase n=1 Tax=Myriangium duriaei CBS 260.36 TaxID=1168546 RepID=A0A9P4JBA2_9PEZI|nr:extradiol ring-cleavage dioxygenase [Myriangium duriaei CBS 260.36]